MGQALMLTSSATAAAHTQARHMQAPRSVPPRNAVFEEVAA